jgi:uncharacterized membrane protein YczE
MQKCGLLLGQVNIKKWLIYLTGFAIFTAGIPFLTHSQLGLSPWDSGLMGLNYFSGWPVTIWSNLLAIIALCLSALMLKRFPNVFTIVSSFLCGLGIDFWVWLIGDKITLPAIPSFILGTLINAFGIAVYLMADALPTSVDYTMINFCKRFNLKIMWGRILVDGIGLLICIVTGGKGAAEPFPEGQGMRDYLVRVGIPAARIVVEDRALNTVQNIANSKALMASPNASVAIVTSNFHVTRGLALARKQGLTGAYAIAAPSTPLFLPNNMLREFFGLSKDFLLGNL